MKKYMLYSIFLLLGAIGNQSGLLAQDSKWSVDVIAGTPWVLSNVRSTPAPLAGVGLRHSANKIFSTQLQVNGGVMTGYSKLNGAFFSNNFLQYSIRGMFNLGPFIHRAGFQKLNTYVYAGIGNVRCFKRQSSGTDQKDLNVTLYESSLFVPHIGMNMRYYLNESIDLLVGSDLNFTQTSTFDNNPGRGYDQFLVSYLGISFRISAGSQRRQNAEWSHIPLPYNQYQDELHKWETQTAEAKKQAEQAMKEAAILKVEVGLAKVELSSVKIQYDIHTMRSKMDTFTDILKGLHSEVLENDQPSSSEPENTTSPQAVQTNDSQPLPLESLGFAAQPASDHARNVDSHQKYAIVLGSFINQDNASHEKKKLTEKGYKVEIVPARETGAQRLILYSDSVRGARMRLNEIRAKENQAAWLFSIR